MSQISKMFKTSDFNPINIKGKPYNSVAERIGVLGSKDLEYSVKSEYDVKEIKDKTMFIVQVTVIFHGEIDTSYQGSAQETIDESNYKNVNFASALENAETSALGRALGMAGIGLTSDFASADEIQKNIAGSVEKLNKNDELALDELLAYDESTHIYYMTNQLIQMAETHQERITLLNNITFSKGTKTGTKKDWKVEDFSHLLSLVKRSEKDDRLYEYTETIADLINSAFLKFSKGGEI